MDSITQPEKNGYHFVMNILDNRTNFKSEEQCTRAKSYQWQAVIKGKVVLSSGVLRNRKRDL